MRCEHGHEHNTESGARYCGAVLDDGPDAPYRPFTAEELLRGLVEIEEDAERQCRREREES